MNEAAKYEHESELWDSGQLGKEEEYVAVADKTIAQAVDDSLGLQMISIRLQKKLIDDLKFIATAHGIGYQPLIRDILSRFVVHEVKQIIRDTIERRELEERKLKEEKAAVYEMEPDCCDSKKVA